MLYHQFLCFFSKNIQTTVKLTFSFLLASALMACGSGSVAEPNTPVTNELPDTPAVEIGEDITTYEFTSITIKGNASPSNGATITQYKWQQLAGPQTDITQTNSPSLSFIAPEVSKTEQLIYELTIIDSKNKEAKDTITITVNDYSIIANAGDDQVVNEQSSVILSATNSSTNGLTVSYNWEQISGPLVTLENANTITASFIAPTVEQDQQLTFKLSIQYQNYLTSDEININVLNTPETIPDHVLLFTNERIAKIKQKIAQDSTSWNYLTSKISNYFDKIPYNAGEYAAAFALAYYVSQDPQYITRAKELLTHAYFSYPDVGWQYYDSRNLFRTMGRWGIMGYSWIKDSISQAEQTRIENILVIWSEYWLQHIDYDNNFANFRIEDTDNVTSLAENITLLGYVLSDSTQHQLLGEKLLDAGDKLLNNYVVNYYMKDIMAGGAWAEGSDYSPNTQRHWIRIFIINKDKRNIPYPINYAHDAMESLIHQTLANYASVYKYGSEEAATDYESVGDDYRYEFALNLMGILEDEKDKAILYQWFNNLLAKDGFKQGSMVTGFQRVMYYDETYASNLAPFPESTFKYASGIGLITSRSNWSSNAANLFFINRNIRVDQEHQDALSFDIAYKGQWITKEATGYAGIATTSIAHNTVLIENASGGNSSPTSRPAGPTKYNAMFDDEKITLISADATQTYNMSGYYATNYAKQVTRQLAFLKPNLVIVYDHIETDKTQINDLIAYNKELGLSEGMEYTRWVKLIQHVQAEPLQLSTNTYQVSTDKSELIYHVAYPESITINTVDEKALWVNESSYNLPDNQKKWHLELSNNSPKENNEFITLLNFTAATANENLTPATTSDYIVLTQENSFITQGNIMGIAVKHNQESFIILFNRTPNIAIDTYQITKPVGYENATIYTIGFN